MSDSLRKAVSAAPKVGQGRRSLHQKELEVRKPAVLPKKRKKGALHSGMGRTERQQHLNNLLWFSPFPSGSQATPHL